MDGGGSRKASNRTTQQPRARLIRYKTRPFAIRWQVGDKRGEVTAGTRNRDEAVAFRALLLRDLAEGYLPGKSDEGPRIAWSDFRLRYELEHLATLSTRYQTSWRTAANQLESIIDPQRLSDLTKGTLSRFRGTLIDEDLSLASVVSYVTTVRAALSWASDMDLLEGSVPRLRRMKRPIHSAAMRSRPTNEEEFERFLMAIPKERPFGCSSLKAFA